MLPEVALTCLPVSIAFGWFYYLVTILAPTFGQVYHLSTGSIGLCFLATGIGNVSGAIFAGIVSDKLYAKSVAGSKTGIAEKELRLRAIYIGVPCIGAGAIMYGWFIHAGFHFMAPLVALCLCTFGICITITVGNTYLVDCNHRLAASGGFLLKYINYFSSTNVISFHSYSCIRLQLYKKHLWYGLLFICC